MKFTKTLAFLMLAVIMVFSLSVNAFATNITVNDGVDGAEYAAYKLLSATDGGDGKFAYAVNSKYEAVLQAVTGKTVASDIIAYIADLADADAVKAFAASVYKAINEASLAADYTTDDDVFDNVEQGYYLIAETKTASAEDTFSLVILDTAGDDENYTVNTKESKPTIEKYVREYNDSNELTSLGKDADHDIGDAIDYVIIATVSDMYAYYNSYYYSFTDTMDKGLTYNNDLSVYITNNISTNSKVDITDYFTVTVTNNSESGLANGFKAEANLKEIPDVDIKASTMIFVEYTATLNEYALIGKPGNENVVYLEYENNPYAEADGKLDTLDKPENPGKTPNDVNIVFTYTASADKIDADGNALSGAGFTLYKWYANADEWKAVGTEITGVTTFNFVGLDAGEYKLVESTVPNGYNKCDDIIFAIEAEYDSSVQPAVLTALSVTDANGNVISGDDNTAIFTTDIDTGVVATNVVNLSGTELPETGGIGTTVFYVVGGILAVVAIVLLIAKKRMAND